MREIEQRNDALRKAWRAKMQTGVACADPWPVVMRLLFYLDWYRKWLASREYLLIIQHRRRALERAQRRWHTLPGGQG
jgi:hypothetical protein